MSEPTLAGSVERAELFQRALASLERELIVLPDKSEENAHNTLCALWHTAAGHRLSAVAAPARTLDELAPDQRAVLEASIRSRLSGVPLAHLTERQCFMGLEYIVGKGLYIPRKETELLAETAIATIVDAYDSHAEVLVADLCTGVGTVALAIGHHCSNTRVFGSDVYAPAIAAAKVNALHLGLDQRATFFNADLFEPFESATLKGSLDVVVSAPPYISSAKVENLVPEIADHEPRAAFDAGAFGLSVFNKLIALAPNYLRPDGHLIFECGLGQGDFLAKRLGNNPYYRSIVQVRDANGDVRVLKASGSARRQ